uniref:Vitelline membrane outer layer 1 homolog a n=1 Tax=Cyprinus carpio TaxID=7962 RepID=A0A8C2J8W6_CYPCA
MGWDDNKGLTGIRLHCISLSNVLKGSFEDYTSVQSEVGSWGWWTDIKWCPCGFLTAFQLRVESSQLFGDDTAANNIMFRCTQEYLYGDGTLWGKWGDWSQMCRGTGICGIKTRIEEPQGSGDDTALNDVRIFNCSREQVLEGDGRSRGEWSGWSQKCEGIGICGISTLREGPQGNRNYSVLKNVRMYCCS